MQLLSYAHVNQVLTTLQTTLFLAFNVKKGANLTITNIFLHMHRVYTMSNVKIRPVRKLKENGPFLPNVCLTGAFFCVFPKIVMISFTRSWTSLPSNNFGAVSFSTDPLKAFISHRYGWNWFRNLRCRVYIVFFPCLSWTKLVFFSQIGHA